MSETQTITASVPISDSRSQQDHDALEIELEQVDLRQTSPAETAAAVPDGGAGWTVITACAVVTWWFVGTTYSWGIIQAALVNEGLAAASTLSFVGSMTVTWIAILAIVNAKVVTAVGAKNSGLIGISLLSAGEILGGFATKNVGGLFATIGVLMGLGTR